MAISHSSRETVNRKEIDLVGRDEVIREDLEHAIKQVQLGPKESRSWSGKRKPTREELNRRSRLERRD